MVLITIADPSSIKPSIIGNSLSSTFLQLVLHLVVLNQEDYVTLAHEYHVIAGVNCS